jgi:hypothetical protein
MLNLEDDNEQEKTLYLVKHEIIDMADKFDDMQGMICGQRDVLQAIVKSLA